MAMKNPFITIGNSNDIAKNNVNAIMNNALPWKRQQKRYYHLNHNYLSRNTKVFTHLSNINNNNYYMSINNCINIKRRHVLSSLPTSSSYSQTEEEESSNNNYNSSTSNSNNDNSNSINNSSAFEYLELDDAALLKQCRVDAYR